VCSSSFQLRNHHRLCAQRYHDSRWSPKFFRRYDTSQSGITAGRRVEVGVAITRSDVCKEVIANAAGLERAGGLEVFEFEEDSAALSQIMCLLIVSMKFLCSGYLPSGCAREGSGLNQWRFHPRLPSLRHVACSFALTVS
jgi:hypothetical protein